MSLERTWFPGPTAPSTDISWYASGTLLQMTVMSTKVCERLLYMAEVIAGHLLSCALVQVDQGQRMPLFMLVGAGLSKRYP